MGTVPSVFAMFSLGASFRDLLFAYLEKEVFSELALL